MERPPESLKTFADRIARTAVSDNAAQMVRLLQLSGLMGIDGDQQAARFLASDVPNAINVTEPNVEPQDSKYIGIWERKIENGKTCFVRRLDTMGEWYLWANLGRIEAKGSKRRLLFLGESVARGYLYDPDFTPAIALQMILDEQLGKGEVEVLDLARTNLEYKIRELALAALQLEPDMAIIFGGNNWSISVPLFTQIAEIDKALTSEGMPGMKRMSEGFIGNKARGVVSDIASEYKRSGVPLIWIIPENNLGDWRDPVTNAPYLSGDLNREWINLYEEARSALSNGDPATAEKLAQKIIEIDQGVCIAGYYILADCRRVANDVEGERKYRELARDAQCWDSCMTFIPKPYSVSQHVIKEEMGKHGFPIVDLPAVFKEYMNGGLPDRRLFLDYCHLTTEGIQLAMGAAASCLLRSLKGVEAPWHTLVGDHIAPPPEIEAEANFLAAIHDGHRWQSYDMVRHHCSQALKFSPHVAELMLNYIDLQTQKSVPDNMSEAEVKIFHLSSPLIHRYLFRSNDKRLDNILLGAMVDVLEEAGIPARERLERRRREEHSVRLGQINLLEYYYYTSSEQPQEVEALGWPNYRLPRDIGYFTAFWPESRFVFVGEAGYVVNLCLTCRLPKPAPRETSITVKLNGIPQVEIIIGTEWTTWDISLPGEAVRDGVNEVVVRWPMPEFHCAEALSKVTASFCEMQFPDFFPIFGEIHSFTASSGSEVPTDSPERQHELVEAEVS
jgi:hypothetical protein